MNRVTLAIIILFGTALGLYWQIQSKDQQAIQSVDRSKQPDYIADDLRSTEYNEQGLVNNKIYAEHMEYFENKNTSYFTNPIFLIYPNDGKSPWHIQSAKGQLNKATGKVRLEKDVIIKAMNPEEPIQTLKTTYLDVNLNSKIMTTDDIVYVTGNGFEVQGKGLYANMNTQIVTLNNEVQGIYEPE